MNTDEIIENLKNLEAENARDLEGITPFNETEAQAYLYFYGENLRRAISAIESAMRWKTSADKLTSTEN